MLSLLWLYVCATIVVKTFITNTYMTTIFYLRNCMV